MYQFVTVSHDLNACVITVQSSIHFFFIGPWGSQILNGPNVDFVGKHANYIVKGQKNKASENYWLTEKVHIHICTTAIIYRKNEHTAICTV